MMFSCKEITEKASEYLDQELPFFTRLKVRMHLQICVHCKRYMDQLQITIKTLSKMRNTDPVDESTVDQVVENIKKNQLG